MDTGIAGTRFNGQGGKEVAGCGLRVGVFQQKFLSAGSKKYRAYVEQGVGLGRRPELVGGWFDQKPWRMEGNREAPFEGPVSHQT